MAAGCELTAMGCRARRPDLCYALVNFALFMIGNQGNPSMSHGKYLLLDHGRLIHELSASQYAASKANEVRGFSGHWLVFYGVPAARSPWEEAEILAGISLLVVVAS